MWLLGVLAVLPVELWGGSYLARSGSDMLAWVSWLKALILLSGGIAYVGSLSPVSILIGVIVFVAGILCLTNYHDRIRATRS